MAYRFLYLRDVVTLSLDQEKCVGCGLCTVVCPHGVLSLNNGTARIENRDACMECGACATNCPTEAIAVERGVGCAAAVINKALGRSGASCCSLEAEKSTDLGKDEKGPRRSCCC